MVHDLCQHCFTWVLYCATSKPADIVLLRIWSHSQKSASPHHVLLPAARKIKLAKPSTWSKEEIIGMKREALLDCFDTMKACYGHAWARTSVDLAIEVT